MVENLMLPELAVIKNVVNENPTTKTFTVQFKKKSLQKKFFFLPGKFLEISVFGYGEMPLGISSSPYKTDYFDLTVMRAGNISNAMHRLGKGDLIGVRGPFGSGFPLNRFRRHSFILVAGGVGFVPIHSIAQAVVQKREFFGALSLFYGAKNPGMLCFKRDLRRWKKECNLFIAVDKADKKCNYHKGFVTDLIDAVDFPLKKTVAVICGPPIMIEVAAKKLNKRGLPKEKIFMSLERLMHCGVGKCAHCNINHKYVCIDGPVFNLKELEELKKEE